MMTVTNKIVEFSGATVWEWAIQLISLVMLIAIGIIIIGGAVLIVRKLKGSKTKEVKEIKEIHESKIKK